MTPLDWALAGLGILGAVLNVMKRRICFAIWVGSNVGLIYANAQRGNVAEAALFGCFTVTSLVGFFTWRG